MIMRAKDGHGRSIIVMDLSDAESLGFCHADLAVQLERNGIIDQDGLPDEWLWPIAIVIQCAGDKPSGENKHLSEQKERARAYNASAEFFNVLEEANIGVDFQLGDILGGAEEKK